MAESKPAATGLAKSLKAASARGVPVVFVRTGDQPDCIRRVQESLNGGRPFLVHDVTRGFTAQNDGGKAALARILDGAEPVMFTDPQTALSAVATAPANTVLCCLAGDIWFSERRPAVAALLLRDRFKANGSMLVVLGSSFAPPPELGADVVVLDDPAPTEPERITIIESIAKDAGITLADDVRRQLLTFTRGLYPFPVEQTCALAAGPQGFDLAVAERTWVEAINSTPGLRVMTDRPTPDMVAGLAGMSEHFARLKTARNPFGAVVFVDEIEKSLAGSSGQVADSSGSSQQVLGRMLTEMESGGHSGSILLGPPGTGKSLAAGMLGVLLGVPTIAFNPSDCKGSLVGETERNASRAMATIRALAGRAYWMATANSLTSLPPELLRRYRSGVFFFDLPSKDERAAIWAVHLKSKGFDPSEAWTDDECWTGSDIRNVVETAYESQLSIADVAKTHVPSSRASAKTTEALRASAINTYFSAQYPGPYRGPVTEKSEPAPAGRKMSW